MLTTFKWKNKNILNQMLIEIIYSYEIGTDQWEIERISSSPLVEALILFIQNSFKRSDNTFGQFRECFE